MPAQTPQQLATAISCLRCLDSGTAALVKAHLLAEWAGGLTDPQAITTAAAPFQGVSGIEAAAFATYALAVIAGGSRVPNTLASEAACWSCADGLHPYAQIALLATLAGASSDPNMLSAAVSGWQGVSNLTAVTLYLLSQKSGLSQASLSAAAACFTCLPGSEQDRVQTMLLADVAGGVTP